MGRIPRELVGFLRRGRSTLVIKGDPGTGKTILSLELLKRFSKNRTGVYLGTRVSAERMLVQHPWLRGIVDSERFLTSATPPRGRISLSDTRFEGSPIERLFQVAMEAENPFVVIDSWEVLTESMEAVETAKAFKVLESLLTSKDATLVFVSETTNVTALDYQADAIVALGHGMLGGRRLRILELTKLRGVRVPQTMHLFSLENGRFRHLPPFTFKGIGEKAGWESIPDSETHFSTGSVNLDGLLGGGYPRGGTVLLEIGSDVPLMGFAIIPMVLGANFISQGRGVVSIPSENWALAELRGLVSSLVGQQAFDRLARFIVSKVSPQQRPYEVKKGGVDIGSDFEVWQKTRDALNEETGQPVLAITAMRAQADRYGEDAYVKAIGSSVDAMRRTGDLEFRMTVPGIERVTEKAVQLADVHLRIETRFGTCYLYGVKPYTAIHGLDIGVSRGVPRLDLTPIV